MEKIQLGKHVELAYEIFVVAADGASNSVYKFTAERPDAFIFGYDAGMIEGFAKAINGLEAGATFDFTLEPKDAFGEKDPELVQVLPKDIFLVDGEFDAEKVYEGAVVPMMTADGHRIDGFVDKVTDTEVTMNFNHQLAGERVRYAGKVIAVRDATPEELHPSGGCGGSCNCGEGGCSGNCGGGCSGCN